MQNEIIRLASAWHPGVSKATWPAHHSPIERYFDATFCDKALAGFK
jgi:hypothetical protein